MAGIYIHVPFCKQKCNYCDFYISVSKRYKKQFADAIVAEAIMRKSYLNNSDIDTVYFGGGTPSLLSITDIDKILNALGRIYNIKDNAEITLEANPDDLNGSYLLALRKLGINRLSVGIQSFDERMLLLLNRSHTAKSALHCVEKAQKTGFDNITIDLIYGLPDMTIEKWKNTIESALQLNVQHISAYHLTLEPNTVFDFLIRNNKIHLPDESTSLQQFEILIDKLSENGFWHYEISNFAKKGFIAHHNSAYWRQKKYLGLGPSAHSYNGITRQWNVHHVYKYLRAIDAQNIPAETEVLSLTDKYNDYIITALRTQWGANEKYIVQQFGDKYAQHFRQYAKRYVATGVLKQENENYFLSRNGIFISDAIIRDFIVVS